MDARTNLFASRDPQTRIYTDRHLNVNPRRMV